MATITGTAGGEFLFGTESSDLINGLGGDDTIDGGLGVDTINGGEGNDVFKPSSVTPDFAQSQSQYDGGDGFDTFDFSVAGSPLFFSFGSGENLVKVADNDIRNVERFIGGSGEDFFFVNRVGQATDRIAIEGGAGNDTIFIQLFNGGTVDANGGSGDDLFTINVGARTLTGGAGQDTYVLNFSYPEISPLTIADFTTGEAGDRIVFEDYLNRLTNWDGAANPFSTGHFRLSQAGSSTLFEVDLNGGGDSFFTQVTFLTKTATTFQAINLDGLPTDGGTPAVVTVTGTATGDFLQGGFAPNVINGLGGNDDLKGGGGHDRLDGGDGHDALLGGAGNDTLIGGAGNDTFGTDGGGVDVFDGGAGEDFFFVNRVGQASDRIAIEGGAGNDTIFIQLFNGGTVDANGGSGDDLFTINVGARTLTGGAGQDTYVLNLSYPEISPLTITDFTTGDAGDRIVFDDYLNRLTNWDGAANPFSTGHFRLRQAGSSTLFEVDLNGGGDGFFTQITFLTKTATTFQAINLDGMTPDGGPLAIQTINGTQVGELLQGSFAPNIINGLGGDDDLRGGGGHDRLDGGTGHDVLSGGAGNDTLIGGEGNDRFNTDGGGIDLFDGDSGEDFFFVNRVGQASDRITIEGGTGNDTIFIQLFNGGTVDANGGSGDDLFTINVGARTLTGGAGQDTYVLNLSYPEISPLTITDFTTGDAGDRIVFEDYLNRLTNWDGAANPFTTGHFRLRQAGSSTLFEVDLDGGGDGFFTQITFLTKTATTFQAINLDGFNPREGRSILGTAGPDTLLGGPTDDTLNGGAGADVMTGGTGNDTYVVDTYYDETIEEAGGGIDLIISSISRTMAANVENLALSGSAGLSGNGNALNNVILGNSGINTLRGFEGDDTLDGGAGADVMIGGGGNDTYAVDAYFDQTIEEAGGGIDHISSSISRTLAANVENLTLSGVANLTGNGNALNNVITGNEGNNALRGHDGDDTLNGNAGQDILTGGRGSDRLAPGTDTAVDIIKFDAVAESTGVTRDLVIGMDLNNEDRFDFPAVPTLIRAQVGVGTLNAATFDANLSAAIGAGALDAGEAVLFDPSAGDLNVAVRVYLIVDANGVAGYQAGADFVVELSGQLGELTLNDFI